MTQQSAEPVLSGVRNFRDVGGLPTADGRRVRRGVLFRSGHLAHATEEDVRFLSGLGLHSVFDFRNSADQALEGQDAALPGVRNVHMPLTDPADGAEFWAMVRDGEVEQLREALGEGRGADRMIRSYRGIIKGRTAEHSRLLHALAEDSVPALMHCAAGKDRAGLSIAITLLALGVDREAIERDYMESNSPHRRYKIVRKPGSGEGIPPEVMELISPLFAASPTYLDAAFTTIHELWGDVGTYLSDGLGLSDGTRARLQERMLEDG